MGRPAGGGPRFDREALLQFGVSAFWKRIYFLRVHFESLRLILCSMSGIISPSSNYGFRWYSFLISLPENLLIFLTFFVFWHTFSYFLCTFSSQHFTFSLLCCTFHLLFVYFFVLLTYFFCTLLHFFRTFSSLFPYFFPFFPLFFAKYFLKKSKVKIFFELLIF